MSKVSELRAKFSANTSPSTPTPALTPEDFERRRAAAAAASVSVPWSLTSAATANAAAKERKARASAGAVAVAERQATALRRGSAARLAVALRGLEQQQQRRERERERERERVNDAADAADDDAVKPKDARVSGSDDRADAGEHEEELETSWGWFDELREMAGEGESSTMDGRAAPPPTARRLSGAANPDAALDAEEEEERALNREVLRFFFEQHDPAQLTKIDELLHANRHRLDEFFLEISSAYSAGYGGLSMAFLIVEEERKLKSEV